LDHESTQISPVAPQAAQDDHQVIQGTPNAIVQLRKSLEKLKVLQEQQGQNVKEIAAAEEKALQAAKHAQKTADAAKTTADTAKTISDTAKTTTDGIVRAEETRRRLFP
jgi:hypothetical protein